MKCFRYTLFLLMLSLLSCTEFIAVPDKQDVWEISRQGKIILYTRPEGFSKISSPDDNTILQILNNQNYYLDYINQNLCLNYQEKVLIYLFNKDEADDLIGTQYGGHAIADKSVIYFSFYGSSHRDHFGLDAYIGAHEIVHVITHNQLGRSVTKMMSEGYAVALDGGYGLIRNDQGDLVAKSIMQWMQQHYDAGKVLSPEDLLAETGAPEAVYYPNAGFFVSYLWGRFGVETVNSMFNVSADSFRDSFAEKTGVGWQQLIEDYTRWYEELLSAR